MTIIAAGAAERFTIHGSTFDSFVRTGRGSAQLCAWRLTVPGGTVGMPHRPSHEEVLLVLAGDLTARIDGVSTPVTVGDVIVVPAGADFCVDSGPEGATAWVTTTAGLTATTADGQELRPPWAQ